MLRKRREKKLYSCVFSIIKQHLSPPITYLYNQKGEIGSLLASRKICGVHNAYLRNDAGGTKTNNTNTMHAARNKMNQVEQASRASFGEFLL